MSHARPCMAAVMTRAANASPSWMFWGFSSDATPAISGVTRLNPGRVPAAASRKNWAMGAALSGFASSTYGNSPISGASTK